MTDKLSVYNNAMLYVQQRKIASLTESSEARRVLDDAWDSTLAYCLSQGVWNFAIRVVQADSSSSVSPSFGFQYAFTKPDDWISTYVVSADERLSQPLLQYSDEAGYWYADCDPLYVKYVSSDRAYGGDLSLWSELFADYVAVRLAARTCLRITGSDAKQEFLLKLENVARKRALSRDAMDESPISPPAGTWTRSRTNFGSSVNGTSRGLPS